jgi:hypothetical protein
MKNIFLFSVFALFATLGISSCTSDDDSSNDSQTIAQLESSIKTGTWRISRFIEDGDNQTNHFNGYVFTFNENGTVIATNGTNTIAGTWVTTNGSSSSSGSNPKFILQFEAANGPFEEISEDWRIESATSSIVDLKNVSGGDGSIDLLTFTKI